MVSSGEKKKKKSTPSANVVVCTWEEVGKNSIHILNRTENPSKLGDAGEIRRILLKSVKENRTVIKKGYRHQ